jgi:hypothetical protein
MWEYVRPGIPSHFTHFIYSWVYILPYSIYLIYIYRKLIWDTMVPRHHASNTYVLLTIIHTQGYTYPRYVYPTHTYLKYAYPRYIYPGYTYPIYTYPDYIYIHIFYIYVFWVYIYWVCVSRVYVSWVCIF